MDLDLDHAKAQLEHLSAPPMAALLPSTTSSPSALLPTVTHLAHFLASYFPIRNRDVPFVYHNPRPPPSRHQQHHAAPPKTQSAPPLDAHASVRALSSGRAVSKLVLSITPTTGVYTALSSHPQQGNPSTNTSSSALAFIHRPFTLDRRRLPRTSHVVSSHVGFDEVLTVGWNPALAARLGLDVPSAVCLQGYKGDPQRRIGFVGAPITTTTTTTTTSSDQSSEGTYTLAHALAAVRREFGAWDSVHGFDVDAAEDLHRELRTVAIMNAFHPEEVERVLRAAVDRGWLLDTPPEASTEPGVSEEDMSSTIDASSVLYVTGAAREPGLVAAARHGMNVVCVGHQTCEAWGIRYLAEEVRREFPGVEVVEVDEDEEPRPEWMVQRQKEKQKQQKEQKEQKQKRPRPVRDGTQQRRQQQEKDSAQEPT